MKKKKYSLVRIHEKETDGQEELIFESLEEALSQKKTPKSSAGAASAPADSTGEPKTEHSDTGDDNRASETAHSDIKDNTKESDGNASDTASKRKQLSRPQVIAGHVTSVLGSIACAGFLVILLAWIVFNVHPDIYAGTSGSSGFIGNVLASVTKKTANMKGDVLNDYLSESDIIKKIYTIPEDVTVAPAPDSDCYGTIPYSEAEKVFDVIEQARRYRLLDKDERCVFSTDVDFYELGEIEYYLDETIMVICWKEWINRRPVNIVEIRIADGSQLRRKVTGDTYGSGIQSYCSVLSKQTNSVIGFNADFYAFRNVGITCYNRTVYRFMDVPYGTRRAYNCLDTLFIDSNGDFKYFERGTVSTKEEVQKFVDENDILFSVSFGPILIKDGELYNKNSYVYPIGEYADEYSRAGLGQVSEHHYLYMNVQNSPTMYGVPRATMQDFAEIMYGKDLWQAYNLDGGQTGEIFFNGHVFNYVDWGNERAISDIFYFATAIPEDERD